MVDRKKLVSVGLLAVLLASCFSINVGAVTFFNDGQIGSTQETEGSLDAWGGVSVGSGGSIIANDESNPHHGVYNFKSSIPLGQTAGFFCMAYTPSFSNSYGTLFARVMNTRFDQLPEDNGDRHYMFGFYDTVASSALVRAGVIRNGEGDYKWIIRGISSGTTFTDYQGSSTPEVNTNYVVELQVTRSNDVGVYRLWVDGVLEIEVTGLDNDARSLNYYCFGCLGSTTPDLSDLNVFWDCVVVSESYNGAELDSVGVVLNAPADAGVVETFACNFNFTPLLVGVDSFQNASLIVNGSLVASNQTALTNATVNTISYTLPSNGTYLWNVQVFNSTNSVLASENFTLTVSVYVPPEPTPTPTISPTATALSLTAEDALAGAIAIAVVFFGCCVGLIFAVRKREDD